MASAGLTKMLTVLHDRSKWARIQALKIHKFAPQTRIASSLSCVEIMVVLYYGRFLRFDPRDVNSDTRDRFIISKGHGAISVYPILADLGFFSPRGLTRICQQGSVMGSIPDPIIRGIETINGSLGHGLGVACGIALALKRKKMNQTVFVLIGDGELYEGSVWEAVMFAGAHKLDNLVLIVDNNKACMLDFCRNIIDLSPVGKKFAVFNWDVKTVDGHDVKELYTALKVFKCARDEMPKVLIAETVKGKGVPRLETDPLSHIKSLGPDEVDALIRDME
jgi:transketolase